MAGIQCRESILLPNPPLYAVDFSEQERWQDLQTLMLTSKTSSQLLVTFLCHLCPDSMPMDLKLLFSPVHGHQRDRYRICAAIDNIYRHPDDDPQSLDFDTDVWLDFVRPILSPSHPCLSPSQLRSGRVFHSVPLGKIIGILQILGMPADEEQCLRFRQSIWHMLPHELMSEHPITTSATLSEEVEICRRVRAIQGHIGRFDDRHAVIIAYYQCQGLMAWSATLDAEREVQCVLQKFVHENSPIVRQALLIVAYLVLSQFFGQYEATNEPPQLPSTFGRVENRLLAEAVTVHAQKYGQKAILTTLAPSLKLPHNLDGLRRETWNDIFDQEFCARWYHYSLTAKMGSVSDRVSTPEASLGSVEHKGLADQPREFWLQGFVASLTKAWVCLQRATQK